MKRVRERGKIGKTASLSKKGQNRGRRWNNSKGCFLPDPISPSYTHGSRTALKYDCWASAKQGPVGLSTGKSGRNGLLQEQPQSGFHRRRVPLAREAFAIAEREPPQLPSATQIGQNQSQFPAIRLN